MAQALFIASLSAAAWEEDFSASPLASGWNFYGATDLFEWEGEAGRMNVTWDSSRPNSYAAKSLGTILTSADDFLFGFELELRDIAIGVDPEKPYTFQLALGLINLADATSTNFFRGAGLNAQWGPRNLVEFSYFPDSGFGATFAPTVVSTNNRIAFSDNHPLVLTTGDVFRVELRHDAGEAMLYAEVTRNGEPYGLSPDDALRPLSLAGFPGFRVDHAAICSYSDGQQFPPQFAGSLLARGWVNRLWVETPEPPVRNLELANPNPQPQIRFLALDHWDYVVESATDLTHWQGLATNAGQAGWVTWTDERTAVGPRQFYRVRAIRRP